MTAHEPMRGVAPSELVGLLITRGRMPRATVPFPRYDEQGQVITNVTVRLLNQAEEDAACANASLYAARMMSQGNQTPWKEEDLVHNARAAEILAVACRHPDDPTRPFFEHGPAETRLFLTDELGQLMLTYAELKENAYKGLRDMSKAEMDAWVKKLAEGALSYPFVSFSRAKLEELCVLLAMALEERRDSSSTPTSSSTSLS